MRKMEQIGYTLVELLITVAIIGILAAIAIPSYQVYIKKSRRGEAKELLTEIQSAQEQFRSIKSRYAGGLNTLVARYGVPTAGKYFTTIGVASAAPNTAFTITVSGDICRDGSSDVWQITQDRDSLRQTTSCD